MIYVPTHMDVDASWKLSAKIWAQVSGVHNGSTKYLVAPIVHPETGNVYFRMSREKADRFGLDTANALNEWPKPEGEFF